MPNHTSTALVINKYNPTLPVEQQTYSEKRSLDRRDWNEARVSAETTSSARPFQSLIVLGKKENFLYSLFGRKVTGWPGCDGLF